MKETYLGDIFGLRVSFLPSAVVGFLGVWMVLSAAGLYWLRFPVGIAVALALAATLLHWGCELLHHLGHAWAARRTGHPMTGIRFWAMLASSLYPADEPALPGRVHIQRALGGPAMNALISVLLGLLCLAMPPYSPLWWLVRVLFLDNLFVFTLQVFLPLGFNDGATILRWINKKS